MSVSFVARISKISPRCRAHAIKVLNARGVSPSLSVPSISPRQFTSAVPEQEPIDPSENNAVASKTRPDWRIVAAIIVQRMPLLVRDKLPLQLKHEEMVRQACQDKSKLSDFELEELEFEHMKKERIKQAEEDITYTKAMNEGADNFEDLQESREMELQDFKPAPRETEADVSGDVRSLNRKLDRVLYMLVKKPRKDHAWQVPQGGIEGDETLFMAAKREVLEECGPNLKLTFYSHAPQAVLSYTHLPPSTITKSKVFFMKALYNDGVVQLDQKELSDYAWVTKEEMQGYVTPEYYNAIEPILME